MPTSRSLVLLLWVAGWVAFTASVASSVAFGETKRVRTQSRLVELAVDAPGGSDVTWEAKDPVDQEMRTYLLQDGRSVCVFWMTARRVVMVSDLIDWEARKREKVTWIVDLSDRPGPDPPPGPDVPDPPSPGLGVKAVARESLQEVSPRGLVHRGSLANNFLGTAGRIRRGLIHSEEDARAELQEANRKVLGQEGELDWQPWLVSVGKYLGELRSQGKIPSLAVYADVLMEISEGLAE